MLTLGGDHFITYPLLKAHARRHGPLSLIHFDAHSDTWPDEEGKRIDHGTMFWHAAREGWSIRRARCRSACAPPTTISQGFAVLDARQVHRRARGDHRGDSPAGGRHPVYLTFDIDCLDPALRPAPARRCAAV
jgi:agmatinase